jgi:hypothetical protein
MFGLIWSVMDICKWYAYFKVIKDIVNIAEVDVVKVINTAMRVQNTLMIDIKNKRL